MPRDFHKNTKKSFYLIIQGQCIQDDGYKFIASSLTTSKVFCLTIYLYINLWQQISSKASTPKTTRKNIGPDKISSYPTLFLSPLLFNQY